MNSPLVISKMFSFPLWLEHFFVIDQKQEFEWKLIQSFSQQMINNQIHDEFERYYNFSILPYQAVNLVFQELNKINEIIGLIIKIRKDIIYSQYKEANTNENSSMFNTYQSLQKYLDKQFLINMHPQYRKYQLTDYGIFDLLVFNHLHKSRSFHRVIHKGVAPQISDLFNWYEAFRNQFDIKEFIDPNYLPKKEKRVQIQKITVQKSNPDLIESIRDDKFDKFKELLSNGASLYTISLRDKEKMMVPHLVCVFARMNFAEYLQTLNVDWECEDGDRMTPLFYAIRSESIQMIEFLLNLKVNLEHKDVQDRTPFYYACSLGFLTIIRYLTERGANINARTALGRTPFSKSSFLGLYNIVEFLLQQPNIDFNYADKQGRDALHNAVFGPKGGRDGRKVGTWCYDSPLIAQMLLEHGMDVESEDKDRNTPLHVAASSEALSSIPVLIAFGCDIDRRNKWGETALMIAAKFNHYETAKLLVENNCDYFIVNEGYTAMEVAAKNNQFEAFEYLLGVMKKDLLQLQKNNKFKLQSLLQSLMILTKDFNPNPFIKHFLQEFQPIYDDDHISLIIDMKDCQKELMVSCLKNQNVTQQQIQISFEQCLKRKNLEIFKQLCHHIKTDYIISLQKTLITMMIDISELNEIIFQFNIDWFNYRSKQGETILHRLVEKRKTETLLLIINFFQDIIDCKSNQKYKNQTIQNISKQQIYEFLIFQNFNSSSIIEIAVIHKFMDIYQMLDHFISLNFEQKQGLKFKIQEYSVEIDNETKLPQIQIIEDQNYQFFKNIQEIYPVTQKELALLNQVLQQYKQGKLKLSGFYQQYQASKPVILVETNQQLTQCAEEILQNSLIIGVDIEHYSDKLDEFKFSFACSIQLSTIEKDFVIDVMKLRADIYKNLNPIFQSAKILKLFHGCDVDLRVLFSDLRIQVINVLDTSRIDMALAKSPNAQSLEKLCKQYLNVHLDKLYQTSDWRIRPLPHQMIEYARLDSSCLLFLYPILIDECRKQNIVTKVFNQCQKLSLIQQYPLLKIINKD